MSPEAKEAQREKSKFAMQKRHELETKEQTALAKDKHREKQRLSKTRKCQDETEEETKLHRENDRFEKKRHSKQRLMRKQNRAEKMQDLG
jgi:hypothetical protein